MANIIVVDMSQTNRLKLYGHIIVAAEKEQGLIVSQGKSLKSERSSRLFDGPSGPGFFYFSLDYRLLREHNPPESPLRRAVSTVRKRNTP